MANGVAEVRSHVPLRVRVLNLSGEARTLRKDTVLGFGLPHPTAVFTVDTDAAYDTSPVKKRRQPPVHQTSRGKLTCRWDTSRRTNANACSPCWPDTNPCGTATLAPSRRRPIGWRLCPTPGRSTVIRIVRAPERDKPRPPKCKRCSVQE